MMSEWQQYLKKISCEINFRKNATFLLPQKCFHVRNILQNSSIWQNIIISVHLSYENLAGTFSRFFLGKHCVICAYFVPACRIELKFIQHNMIVFIKILSIFKRKKETSYFWYLLLIQNQFK